MKERPQIYHLQSFSMFILAAVASCASLVISAHFRHLPPTTPTSGSGAGFGREEELGPTLVDDDEDDDDDDEAESRSGCEDDVDDEEADDG